MADGSGKNEVKIVRASPENLEQISKIAGEGLKYHSKFEQDMYSKEELRILTEYYTHELRKSIQKDIFFVAIQNEQVVGYIYGDIKKWCPGHKVGSIIDIEVSSNLKDNGIGSRLIREIEKVFREKGCKESMLEVLTRNVRAFEFYNKLGYRPWKYYLKSKL